MALHSLQPLTECPIHMGPFERPKLLPECQHTFCEDCLKRCQETSGGSLLCPTCRYEYGRIDVHDLPNDRTTLALLQAIDSPVDATKSKIKDVRCEKHKARATVTLKLKNMNGQAVEDRSGVGLIIKVVYPGGGIVEYGNEDTCREYTFRLTSSGTYKIYASVNGTYLSNSPRELTIFPPLRQTSSVFGEVKYEHSHDVAAFEEELFVTDKGGHCVVVTNRSGKHLRSFEIKETNMFAFEPFGIAISKTGLLYITDMYNHEVFVCDTRGKVRQRIGKDVLKKPNGVALTKNNEILVVDYDQCCLFMFENDGKLKRTFCTQGKDYGQFNHPWFVAINSKGDWIVSDCDNRRLQIFDNSGTVRFMKPVPVGHLVRGVVVDSADNIFVSVVIDRAWLKRNYKHAVMMYDSNGNFYGEVSDHLRGDLFQPRGMCITKDGSGEDILIVTGDREELHKYKLIK
ncbi:uncharacterized protein [Antedon mediterranea]|uniref:uncharacterized protein n=1 Tax=Antedon mediterranea TaxID=105859 RepID=UPI003AF5E716